MNIRKAKKLYKNTVKWVVLQALIECKRAAHIGRMKMIPKFRNRKNSTTKLGKSLSNKQFLFFKQLLNGKVNTH